MKHSKCIKFISDLHSVTSRSTKQFVNPSRLSAASIVDFQSTNCGQVNLYKAMMPSRANVNELDNQRPSQTGRSDGRNIM